MVVASEVVQISVRHLYIDLQMYVCTFIHIYIYGHVYIDTYI